MQNRSKKILEGIITTKRIASGYIFIGGANEAKLNSAKYFAKALNCSNSINPCNACISCTKADKNVNPDIIIIEKDKSSIKIEQIRNLKELTKYGPSESSWQIVIINEADTLTIEAANSFLKLLEEPPPQVVFILISDREGNLPKTIESRCQKIIFEESDIPNPQEEVENFFNKMDNGKFDYIDMTEVLGQTKEPKEFLRQLYSLYAQAHKASEAKIVLDILKGIERKANQKLALDLLCIKLWETN